MDIFEIADSFDTLSPSNEKEALLHYLQTGSEERALAFLDRVGMLDRAEGADFLAAALSGCSAALFRRLLDHVPRGEYAGFWMLEDGAEGVHGSLLFATLPTLAAAKDKPEHLRLLLDWGCDVNGASLDAATAMANRHRLPPRGRDKPVFRPGAPATHGQVWWKDTARARCTDGVTPLSAAILFGSVACTRLLLGREGVWLTETPSVSEALAMPCAPWDTEANRECRRLVRTREDGTLRPLLLWAAIRRMDATALRDELCRCAYGSEEVTPAALTLLNSTTTEPEKRWAMLAVLDGRCPGALRDERIARKLAARAYVDYENRDKPLPACVEHALGETVDLDESNAGAEPFTAREEPSLRRLGVSRKLTMSRDAVTYPIRTGVLRALLRNVEFRAPSLPLGVSGLTAAILRSGDTRLLGAALDQGLIPAEEPLERLLELAGKNSTARSLLLTHPRPSLGCAAAGAERESFRVLTKEEAERVMTDPALRAQASDALLRRLDDETLQRRGASSGALSAEGIETLEYTALYALRGETDTVLRLALHRCRGGEERAQIVRVWRADAPGSDMILTLLCCAAVTGRTETVRALLDAGFDAEERDMGRPSEMWIDSNGERIALSPLLCALLWARWDTAALLLSRGAACDLTTYTARRAFEAIRGGDVPYGDIRRELGPYLEGRRLGK